MHRRPRRYCVNFWWHLLRQRWGITIYAGKFDGRGLEAVTELTMSQLGLGSRK